MSTSTDDQFIPSVTPLGVTVPPGPLGASIQRQVEQALGEMVPAGRTGAAVAVLTREGAAVTVATRLDPAGHWTLAGQAATTWGGDVSGQVMLVGSW